MHLPGKRGQWWEQKLLTQGYLLGLLGHWSRGSRVAWMQEGGQDSYYIWEYFLQDFTNTEVTVRSCGGWDRAGENLKVPVGSAWAGVGSPVSSRLLEGYMLSLAVVGMFWYAKGRTGSATTEEYPHRQTELLTFTAFSPRWLCSQVAVSTVSLSLSEPKMMCVGLSSGWSS